MEFNKLNLILNKKSAHYGDYVIVSNNFNDLKQIISSKNEEELMQIAKRFVTFEENNYLYGQIIVFHEYEENDMRQSLNSYKLGYLLKKCDDIIGLDESFILRGDYRDKDGHNANVHIPFGQYVAVGNSIGDIRNYMKHVDEYDGYVFITHQNEIGRFLCMNIMTNEAVQFDYIYPIESYGMYSSEIKYDCYKL